MRREYDKEHDDELRAALVGRTITAVEREWPKGDWSFGYGDMKLTLDDGSIVDIEASGYDASSLHVILETAAAA